MIQALAILGGVIVVQVAVLIAVLWLQHDERRDWRAERRMLTDRVIAKDTREVLALDKSARLDREPEDREERPLPPLIAGMS